MAEEIKKYAESLGYRVNALVKQADPIGTVTVFAERRNKDSALGHYGGDSVPAVYEKNFAGFVLDSDGLGNGGFVHRSLGEYLEEYTPADFNTDRDAAKLSLFLRKLFGKDFFDDKYKAAQQYALRCFSPVPADGYFASEVELWSKPDTQVVRPFYGRDSQSLGSRILCVGLYKMLLDVLNNKKLLEKDFAELAENVRDRANKYIKSLASVVNELGLIRDADSRTIGRYVLPNTVAFWFYRYDEKRGKVNAAAVSIGDARCYALDTVDGVRQISVDDAAEDGDITSLIHFGNAPKNDATHFDNEFRVRTVELTMPCALMACSDGVYDTCPFVKKRDRIDYGNVDEVPSDIMFEKNLLDALRDCRSMDDFKRKIVFEFYAQSKGGSIAEKTDSNGFTRAKRDDSGTLAARFFGKYPLELFDALRENTHTSLDKLYDTIVAAKNECIDIPYKAPHIESRQERDEAKINAAAVKLMDGRFTEILKALYAPAFECMLNSGSNMLWGLEQTSDKPLAGFGLGQFFKKQSVKNAVLNVCISDWEQRDGNKFPPEWKTALHEHIIVNADVFEQLMNIGFDDIVKSLESSGGVDKNDMLLELYAWFEKCFYGETNKPRGELWGNDDGKRVPPSLDELKAIVKKYQAPAPQRTAPATSAADGVGISSPAVRAHDGKGDKK